MQKVATRDSRSGEVVVLAIEDGRQAHLRAFLGEQPAVACNDGKPALWAGQKLFKCRARHAHAPSTALQNAPVRLFKVALDVPVAHKSISHDITQYSKPVAHAVRVQPLCTTHAVFVAHASVEAHAISAFHKQWQQPIKSICLLLAIGIRSKRRNGGTGAGYCVCGQLH